MTRKLGLSKLRSERIFIYFSLQCKIELEDWLMLKRTLHWDRSKSFSASESLLWALILDLHHKQTKSHFSWESLDKVIFVTWNRQPTWYWYYMIQDTELTALHLSPASGACAVGPFCWALELGAEWPTHYAWTTQGNYSASLWHHITSPIGPYNQFKMV